VEEAVYLVLIDLPAALALVLTTVCKSFHFSHARAGRC
jgi:hypothetical protein